MKLVIFDKENKPKFNNMLNSIIHIIVYALILVIISSLFKTIEIDNKYYGLYGIIASIIIYILNNTIKPILFKLTIPITGLTMGLFYPCINIIILKITDLILGNHFETHGILSLFFTAVLISLINILVDELIIKPIIKRSEKR